MSDGRYDDLWSDASEARRDKIGAPYPARKKYRRPGVEKIRLASELHELPPLGAGFGDSVGLARLRTSAALGAVGTRSDCLTRWTCALPNRRAPSRATVGGPGEMKFRS
jgi:hypothetical protein